MIPYGTIKWDWITLMRKWNYLASFFNLSSFEHYAEIKIILNWVFLNYEKLLTDLNLDKQRIKEDLFIKFFHQYLSYSSRLYIIH